MIIQSLNRHLAICGLADVQRFLDPDPGFWHVISIRDTVRPSPGFQRAAAVHPFFFDDADVVDAGGGWVVMSEAQAREIWNVVDSSDVAPLLIHCTEGRSRSTAVAAALVARALADAGTPLEKVGSETTDVLLEIRPRASPNGHVLFTMLRQKWPESQARDIAKAIWEDDRIKRNRNHSD
jgi:predicted protein tyrosine phosphatase